MTKIMLFTDHKLRSKPGSFGARIDAAGLHLPLDVRLAALLAGWHTAEQFYLSSLDFPQVFVTGLSWTEEDCKAARLELRDLLKGHLPDDVLDPPAPVPYAFGALPPDDGFEE